MNNKWGDNIIAFLQVHGIIDWHDNKGSMRVEAQKWILEAIELRIEKDLISSKDN